MANHGSFLCSACRKPVTACSCSQAAHSTRQLWNNGLQFLTPHRATQHPQNFSHNTPLQLRPPTIPYHTGPFSQQLCDPRMYSGYYLPPGVAIPMSARLPVTPRPVSTSEVTRNPLTEVSSPMQAMEDVPAVHRKRKRTNGATAVSKRSRRTQESSNVVDENSDPSTTSIPGVGPASSPIHLPTEVPAPIADKHPLSNSNKDKKVVKSKQAATDVWYFMRPLETREPPSDAESLSKIPVSQTKPKTEFVGCRLCHFPEKWRVWANVNGIADTIRTHLSKDHQEEWRKIVLLEQLKGWDNFGQNCDSMKKGPFTVDGFLQRLSRWIVVDDQSLNVIECEELRDLLLYLNADLEERDIPHWTKLTKLIFESYKSEWNKLVSDLQKSKGRISTTSDLWTDPNLRSFMALTVHYCSHDQNGNLRVFSRLAAFRYISGVHSGVNLAENFIKVLKELGILHKLGMITLDNASNCQTMMEHLGRLLQEYTIPFSAEGYRIWCFPHVINIAVQAALKELSKSTSSLTGEDAADSPCFEVNMCDAEYELALSADPVLKCRKLVTACRASGARRSDLQSTIEDGNESKSFPNEQQLRRVQLLRDVDTRWSSTYLMISRALELYPAIDVLLNKVKYKEIHKHLLSEIDLKVLKDISQFLEIPHSVQTVLCGEKTPTLPAVLPAYEELLELLKEFKYNCPQLNRAISTTMAKIEEYVNKSRRNRVYALAMIINPATKLKWIEEHWTADESRAAKDWMLEAMFEFRKAERKTTSSHSSQPQTRFSGSTASSTRDPLEKKSGLAYIRSLRNKLQNSALHNHDDPQSTTPSSGNNISTQVPTEEELRAEEKIADENDKISVAEELQRYLSEGVLEDMELKSDFLTRHWQADKHRYPTMYRVALDILPIQASSVACERVFSSSKETITMRRSCLSTALMEVLQFLKYSYRRERLNLMEGVVSSEDDLLQDNIPNVSPEEVRDLLGNGQIDTLVDLLRDIQ